MERGGVVAIERRRRLLAETSTKLTQFFTFIENGPDKFYNEGSPVNL